MSLSANHGQQPVGARSAVPPVPPSSPASSPASSSSSSSFLDIPSFVVTGGNATIAKVRAVLQRISSQSRSPVSMLILALSVTIVNHARRTFFHGSPWAGFFALRPDFADDWRVVLARPDIYLDTFLASANLLKLTALVISHVLWDQAAFFVSEQLETSEKSENSEETGTAGKPHIQSQAAAIGFMVWLLAEIEASLAQSSAAVATVWSLLSLLQTNPSLLMRILTKQRLGVSLLAYPLAYFILAGLVPTVVSAAKNSWRGKPGVLLTIIGIVGSLYTLLVYRSRLYIAIETSGLFVFLGTFVVSASLLIRAQSKVEESS